MNISAGDTLNNYEASDGDVLTNGENLIFYLFFNGVFTAVELRCEKSSDISGLVLYDCCENLLYKFSECCVICDEVGFCVDFNHCGDAISLCNVNDTFSCNSCSFLIGDLKTLFTKELYSLVEITVSFNKCFLALHHADAGLGSESHYVFCGNVSHD